jgi:toxin ParE1/3/4
MMRVRYLSAAQRNLDDIFAYVYDASGDEATAEAAVRRLFEQCRKLSTLPGTLGQPRPELAPDLRSFPFRGYLIFSDTRPKSSSSSTSSPLGET